MSVEVVKRAIRNSLERSDVGENTPKLAKVGFRNKKLIQGTDVGTGFLADEVYMVLQSLAQTQLWVKAIAPKSSELVEGLDSLSMKIDLTQFDKIAEYAEYQRQENRPDSVWKSLIQDAGLSFQHFAWKHWGDTPKQAIQNIQSAESLLRRDILSRHQISSIISRDAKRISEQDINDLLVIYPELKANLRQRKVILNYHCIEAPNQCLIVENMDTYHYLQEHAPDDWMLVCGFGQRVTKADVEDLDIVDLHSSFKTPGSINDDCLALWADKGHKKLYWGDLDKNGMQIYRTLKERFPELVQWEPAYLAMHTFSEQTAGADVHQEAILIRDMNNPWGQ